MDENKNVTTTANEKIFLNKIKIQIHIQIKTKIQMKIQIETNKKNK